MKVSKYELEEMLGYSLEELEVMLNSDNLEVCDEIELTRENLTLLFERVREQTWHNAQEQFSEWGY